MPDELEELLRRALQIRESVRVRNREAIGESLTTEFESFRQFRAQGLSEVMTTEFGALCDVSVGWISSLIDYVRSLTIEVLSEGLAETNKAARKLRSRVRELRNEVVLLQEFARFLANFRPSFTGMQLTSLAVWTVRSAGDVVVSLVGPITPRVLARARVFKAGADQSRAGRLASSLRVGGSRPVSM